MNGYEYGVLLSHASEDTGELISNSFPEITDAMEHGQAIIRAQPGISYSLMRRVPGGKWFSLHANRTPKEELAHLTSRVRR